MRAPRVALIGCGKLKSSRTCAAAMMYRSALFRSSLRYAVATCDKVFVLSAKHGLLPLDRVIEPYDQTLPRDRAGREAWGRAVAAQLDQAVPDLDTQIVVLAGERYADAIIPEDREYLWEEPLRGLSIGERLAWLRRHGPSLFAGQRDQEAA